MPIPWKLFWFGALGPQNKAPKVLERQFATVDQINK